MRGGSRSTLRLSVVAVLLLMGSASSVWAQAKRVSNDPTQWRAELPALAHVPQQNFYPGIDLIFGGHQEKTSGVFIVRPGGNPDDILLDFFEASGVTLKARGEAQVQTPDGAVRVIDLQAYQPMQDLSRGIVGRSGPDVPARFVQRADNQLSLQVGAYDRSRPLWIKFELRFPGYEALMANKTATTFTVTRLDDPAPGACLPADCSLREAVIAANASPGADIINLGTGTYQLTITTGEDGGTNAAAAGDLDINDDVTINGGGAASTIIEYASPPAAGCDCKIFGINQDGLATDIQVTISGVTMRNANNSPSAGFFQDTGGGVDIFLTPTNPANGLANVQFSNCVIDNNAVSNATANAYGGGINIDSGFGTLGAPKGSVTITNCDITNNTADAVGGGINMFADRHDVTLTGGSVSGNTTLGTGGLGANGGGINIRPTNGGTYLIDGTTFNLNDAKGPGGGIAVAETGSPMSPLVLTIQDLTISNNTSRDGTGNEARGGGIFNNHTTAPTAVTNVIITSNHADLGTGDPRGGGIYNNGGTLNVTGNSTISNNTSVEGGGISNTNVGATTNVTGGSITGNAATGNGGGVHVLNGSVSLSGVTLQGNDADSDTNGSGDGGGIFRGGGTLTMTGATTIGGLTAGQENTAFNGGGISNTTGTLNVPTGSILGNQARNHGGGLHLTGGTATLTGITLQGNDADSDTNGSGDGGGIFRGGGTLNFSGTTVIGGTGAGQANTATNGGGISNTTGGFSLTSGSDTITGNQATNNGGGLHNTANSTITLTGVTITDNAANSDATGGGDGGGLFNNGGTLTLDATSVVGGSGNTATNGGGLSHTSGTLTLNGTSVLDNMATNNGGGLHITGGSSTLTSVSLQGNAADSDASGAGDGGGLFRSGGTVTISTTITVGGTAAGDPNSAANGGGIANTTGTLSIPAGSVVGNTATNHGGGLYVTGGTVNVDGTVIQGNAADSDTAGGGDGGGIYTSATVNLGATTPLTVGGSGAGQGNSAANGGGIRNDGGTVTMTAGSIVGNTATTNGGGVLNGGTTNVLTLDNVSVTDNTAVINGGGLASTGGTTNITGGGSFKGNKADSDANNTGDGGAIHNNGGTVVLPNGTTIGGTAAGEPNTAQNGGGIAQVTAGSVTMTGGEITGNTAAGNGGGTHVNGGTLTLNDLSSSIKNNIAGGNGGGVHALGGTVNISKNNIVNNNATGSGGGLYNNGASLTMNYSRILGNTAGTTTGLHHAGGTLTDITNNWWGCNDDPDTGVGCDQTSGTGGAHNPRLVLNHAASPSSVMTGGATTLTADFLTNSGAAAISASNLDVLIGLPITFDNAVLGVISSPEAVIQADGTADATFTAGASLGTGSADATVDNGTATALIDIVGDFGDAPDPSYPTLLASNGARHAGGGPRLGTNIDGEADGQPNATATGDDAAGVPDDEDGVTFTSSLVPGLMASVDIDVQSASGFLNAWVDFTGDGDWGDAGEQIFTEQAVSVGVNSLSFSVPASAAFGTTFARFRVCSSTSDCNAVTGQASDGEVEDYQVDIASLDFGDAPDPTYPTLFASDGARHVLGASLFLGASVDQDADGQPSADAGASGTDGDDGDGNDDDDGVTFTSALIPGQTATVDVTASVAGLLNAWVDFNDDGDWADAGEQIFTDEALAAGTNSLSFAVPGGATTGLTFARFRADTGGGLSFDGLAGDGEVEDYQIEIVELDYGDAPDPTYPTLFASDGARHVLGASLFLGASVDQDADGQPSADAGASGTDGDDGDGNDDDDGVTFTSVIQLGQTATVDVVATATGLLNAWVDFNDDGDWADAGEQIFTDEALAAGTNSLSFAVPGGATTGLTFTRFRADTGGGLSFDGLAGDGEVEDYQVAITDQPDLTVTKDDAFSDPDGDAKANPGDVITYTITVSNSASGGTGINTKFTDTPGTNTALIVGSVTTTVGTVTMGNTAGDTSVEVDLGSFAPSAMVTITFQVTVDNPLPAGVTTVSNQGSVTADNLTGSALTDDPDDPTSNTDPTVTPVAGAADLTLAKDDGGVTAMPGATISYTLDYENTGTQGATGVTVTETVPAHTTFNAGASTPGWACVPDNNAGSTCTLSVGALAGGGASGSATFAVDVDDPVPAGTTEITNEASIADDGTNGTDPNPGDNDATDTTPIEAMPAVTALKTDTFLDDGNTDGLANPGETILYTVVITNNGDEDGTGVVFTDLATDHPGATLVVGSVMLNGGVTGVVTGNTAGDTDVVVDVGALPGGGGVATITFEVVIDDPLAAGVDEVCNKGTVSDNFPDVSTDDPDTAAASDPTCLAVVAEPILVLAKDDGGVAIMPGDTFDYTLTVSNSGNQDATGVVITETVPTHTMFNAGASTPGWACTPTNDAGSTCMFSVGALGAGAATMATFALDVDNPVPAGTTEIANDASVTDDGLNSAAPVTDTAQDTTPVEATPDMALVKDDGGVQVMPGGVVVYTLTYTNQGNEGATGVVVTETVPDNATFNAAASTPGWSCADGAPASTTCTFAVAGEVAGGGGTGAVLFAVQVEDSVPVGVDEITNTASVDDDGTGGVDPTPADNEDSDTTPVSATPEVLVVKMDAVVVDAVGSAGADPGDRIAYTVEIENVGGRAATGVVFTDTVDPNTLLDCGSVTTTQGSLASCTAGAGGSLTIEVGTVSGGGTTVTILFEVEVARPFPKEVFSISNQGSVSGDNFATVETDDPATAATGDATVTEINRADVSITKTLIGTSDGDDGPYEATFLLVVTNLGPNDASGVFASDPLPEGTMLVSQSGGYDAGSGIWTIGELASGASASLTVTLGTDDGDNDLVNLAEVFADQPDPDCDNNLSGSQARHDTDPSRFRADLSLVKTVDEERPSQGALVTYTLEVTNAGPSTTAGVVVSEHLLEGLEFVSATVSNASSSCPACGYDDSLGVWIVGHVPVGQVVRLELTVRVVGTGEIVNTAEIIASHLPDVDSVFGDGDADDDDQASAVIEVSSGKASATVGEGAEGVPTAFELGGNYPNPFNPETVIPFGVPEAGDVLLEVYDVLGKRVAVLVEGRMEAGRHEVTWYAVDAPSGVYLVRLVAGGVQQARRVTLVK